MGLYDSFAVLYPEKKGECIGVKIYNFNGGVDGGKKWGSWMSFHYIRRGPPESGEKGA